MIPIRTLLITTSLAATMTSLAADPMATAYDYDQCNGSLMPYPVPENRIELPDSLTPVFINHVGRHGARFPSSPNSAYNMAVALGRADSLGTITPLGRKLRGLIDYVMETSHNRWGALDSLGMAEQRGIASRMFLNFPVLFNDGVINAISSYAPRCIMSMYEFTHQLDRLNNHVEIVTSAGRQNSPLMRPFDLDQEYIEWRKSGDWHSVYDSYLKETAPIAPLARVLGTAYPLEDDADRLVLDEYKILAGMAAMGHHVDISPYFTIEEYNAIWSCFNLGQYLQRTSSTLSTLPSEITSKLILDLITTADEAVQGRSVATVCLRFGHAETLMPLLSQLHLPGCYYMTNYFDTVAQHWQDFHVVPMASNLQLVITRSTKGRYYMLTLLNEQPVTLIPGDDRTILPYNEARDYMLHCLPLHLQI